MLLRSLVPSLGATGGGVFLLALEPGSEFDLTGRFSCSLGFERIDLGFDWDRGKVLDADGMEALEN